MTRAGSSAAPGHAPLTNWAVMTQPWEPGCPWVRGHSSTLTREHCTRVDPGRSCRETRSDAMHIQRTHTNRHETTAPHWLAQLPACTRSGFRSPTHRMAASGWSVTMVRLSTVMNSRLLSLRLLMTRMSGSQFLMRFMASVVSCAGGDEQAGQQRFRFRQAQACDPSCGRHGTSSGTRDSAPDIIHAV